MKISEAELNHPMQIEIRKLKKIFLDAHPLIKEQIKWNSPSFYFDGNIPAHAPKSYLRDIAVFHLRKQEEVMLIFPNGDKLQDHFGVFKGEYNDGRRMISIRSEADLMQIEPALKQILMDWIQRFSIQQ